MIDDSMFSLSGWAAPIAKVWFAYNEKKFNKK